MKFIKLSLLVLPLLVMADNPVVPVDVDSAEKIFNASMDFNDTSFDALRQKVLLESIYMSFPATHIIHWGNNVPVARWCVEKNIKNYFVEMGFMRTPSIESLVIDSCGVNSLSTISKSDENDFICNQDLFNT